ncbi:enoyl-CoA hydratase/isomerase family protein [Hugenholtzia roseola]|uniref:enoyl-CoA hydratase/isomerase family protein n=1 Tax=Hugenholtzia roseola TaxID=1002 RepID=UPI000416CDF7|nr:enoyl-CoA hydratase/isomerase family protein [Hugenholtzia roseola]
MQDLTYHTENRVAYLTLNRPEKRNAFSATLVAQLKEAFTKAAEDDNVKVVVLQAKGTVFCAGADLAYLQTLQTNTYEENLADSSFLKDLYEQIYRFPKPTIAAVQGAALAGGCGLATVCDFVFAVPEAKFGYTEVKIGFVPAIVSKFLLRKIGEMQARYLLISGELISAQKAEQIGLITAVVEAENLTEKVQNFAQILCKNNSAEAMFMTKKAIEIVQEQDLSQALLYAAALNAQARATQDCKKGIAAFLNKEKIVW